MTEQQPLDAPPPAAWPPRRRSAALPAVLSAMLAIGLASGAYMLWHERLPPDPDGGLRCSRAFDARMRAARGGSDADLDRLGADALAIGCGRQALDAADLADWHTDEVAAWTLSRFSDPGETAPVFRLTVAPDPARAAAIAAAWASRSPRLAEVLARLCAARSPASGTDAALGRACGG